MMNIFSANKLLQYPHHLSLIMDRNKRWDVNPITLDLMPINSCNHNCRECTFKDRHSNDQIPLDIMMKLSKDLQILKIKGVIWTGGGEPLKRGHEIDAVMSAFSENNIKQGLYTNGSLLDNEFMNRISKDFSFIRISLDATTETTHYVIHGSKDFFRILDNIKKLVQLRCESNASSLIIGLSFLVYEDNIHEIIEINRIARELGIDYVLIKPAVSDKEEYYKKYSDKISELLKSASSQSDENLSIIPVWRKFEEIRKTPFRRSYNFCWGQLIVMTIGPNGRLYPCCHLIGSKENEIGDLENNELMDIWQSNKRKEIFHSINVSKCPPNCRLHDINTFIENIIGSRSDMHLEFI